MIPAAKLRLFASAKSFQASFPAVCGIEDLGIGELTTFDVAGAD
jgi:hypothetical protein